MNFAPPGMFSHARVGGHMGHVVQPLEMQHYAHHQENICDKEHLYIEGC